MLTVGKKVRIMGRRKKEDGINKRNKRKFLKCVFLGIFIEMISTKIFDFQLSLL